MAFKHGNYSKGKAWPIHSAWVAMLSRCYNPNNASYSNYGGRGITVCAEWQTNFEQFRKDMGERPKGKSLGRINNDLGYSQSNCRWETPTQQQRNTRYNRLVTLQGITATVTEHCERLDVRRDRTFARLWRGWSVEDAFLRPDEEQVGNRNPSAKLTDDDVVAMRAEHAKGGIGYAALGRKYGVTDVMAGLIVKRKAWSHIP